MVHSLGVRGPCQTVGGTDFCCDLGDGAIWSNAVQAGDWGARGDIVHGADPERTVRANLAIVEAGARVVRLDLGECVIHLCSGVEQDDLVFHGDDEAAIFTKAEGADDFWEVPCGDFFAVPLHGMDLLAEDIAEKQVAGEFVPHKTFGKVVTAIQNTCDNRGQSLTPNSGRFNKGGDCTCVLRDQAGLTGALIAGSYKSDWR